MKRIFILAFILLLAMANTYAGGGNRTGTSGASELLIPIGVRGIAMGQASVATSTGIEALFWNPAGVSKLEGSASVMFSHMNYIADIGVEYGAVSANFEGFGVVSLSIKSLAVGEIPITTTQSPDGTGSTFSPQFLTAGLSYSRELVDRISVGLTANLINETLGDATASGVAFNVGVIYENLGDVDGLSFGVVMKNVGPQMKYSGSALFVQADVTNYNRPPQYYTIDAASFELPSTFELGLGYKPQINAMNSLTVATTFQNNNFSGDEYKFGLEYGYNHSFYLRGGYSMSPKSQTDNYIYGLSMGAGIDYSFQGIDLKLDYAFRDVKYFSGNHVFSLTLGF